MANEGASDDEPTTPLAALHEERGAKFTSFAGWQMPLQFSSILSEHEAVRERAGVFDVSHMGNLEVPATQADELAAAIAADVAELAAGHARYTLVLRENGTILDDIIVFHHEDAFHVVPNAGRNGVVADQLEAQGCGVADLTRDRCILALQGPDTDAVLDEATGLEHPGRFRLRSLPEKEGFVSGTGYTGERGVEFVVDPDHAKPLWQDLVDAGAEPAGLGARDTLRLEKGFPLAGNEFDPPVTPVEAQMLWAIDLEHDFVGRSDVVTRREAGPERLLVGIRMDEKGIPRRDCPVYHDGQGIGQVSSGTMSPTLDVGIALAYVDPAFADEGTEVAVKIRDDKHTAHIEEAPFL